MAKINSSLPRTNLVKRALEDKPAIRVFAFQTCELRVEANRFCLSCFPTLLLFPESGKVTGVRNGDTGECRKKELRIAKSRCKTTERRCIGLKELALSHALSI